jgi:phage-related protein
MQTQRAESQQQMDEAVRQNAEEQTAHREQAQREVSAQRREWSSAQRDAVRDNQRDADQAGQRAGREVTAARQDGERQAAGHIDAGNREATRVRNDAHRDASAERRRGEQETQNQGFWGSLTSGLRSFFDGIKNAITAVFDVARRLLRAAIEAAQRLALAAIDLARRAIVAAIRLAADALIALADTLLAAFPELRDRFRAAIRRVVDAALDFVNRLADALKAGITALLGFLLSALNAILCALMAAYLAVVNAVASAIQSAIQAARSFVNGLIELAGLIADIAANPVRWVRNLAASVMDGVRNHLWKAFKRTIKQWFNSKVEEVLGLPTMLFQLLRRGGIPWARVGGMVWKGIKAAIPMILIQLAIEQIVQLLIPAAAVVKKIIEFIQAALPAIRRIIMAISALMAFLRAVKVGPAGRQFANLLAAGAIVVIDFLANFLVSRFRRPARPIGGRLQAIGQRIAATLRRVGQAVRRGAQAVVRVARRAVAAVRRVVVGAARAVRTAVVRAGRAIARGVTRVVQAVGRGLRRAGAAIARVGGRVMAVIERRFPRLARVLNTIGRGFRRAGAAVRRTYQRARDWARRQRERLREWWRERKRRAKERARRDLPPRIRALLARGVSQPRMWLTLQAWRLWYQLRVLRLSSGGDTAEVVFANSDQEVLVTGIVRAWYRAKPTLIRELEDEVINDTDVQRMAAHLMDLRRGGAGSAESPLVIPAHPAGLVGAADLRAVALHEGVLPGQGRIGSGHPLYFASAVTHGRVPAAEHISLGEGLASTVEAGYRSATPGAIVLGGAGKYATMLRNRRPENPAAFMTAVHGILNGHPPPAGGWGLSAADMTHATQLARLGQIEAGRGGILSESLGTSLAATPHPQTGQPLLTYDERYGPDQPFVRGDAGRISRAAREHSGAEPIPGLARDRSATRAEINSFLRDELALVARFVLLQVLTQRELYDMDEKIKAYVKHHLIADLKAALFTKARAAAEVTGTGTVQP